MLRNIYNCSWILSDDFSTIYNNLIKYNVQKLNENYQSSVKNNNNNIDKLTESFNSGN